MSQRKIQVTKNYRLFVRHEGENRPTDLKKHRKLAESMKKYGFLSCFPIVCYRDKNGTLVVKDGQHRLMFAESLGLPVYWVEEAVDFDVATINSTSRIWTLRDYAEKHKANGLTAYGEGLDFCDQHRLPIGMGFAMLAGTCWFHNCQEKFIAGTFTIKDRPWATAVVAIYGPLVSMSPALKAQRFLEACMSVCRVSGFNASRLLTNVERCREKLVPFATKDAYLDMLEAVYNYGRQQLFPLKVYATMAMRERNVGKPKDGKTKAGEPQANGTHEPKKAKAKAKK